MDMIFGYMAIPFNLASLWSKSAKITLWLGMGSLSLLALNLWMISGPITGLMITLLGVLISVTSLVLFYINKNHLRPFFIKVYLIPGAAAFLSSEFHFVDFMAFAGFVFATTARLQKEVLPMKTWFLASALTWLIFNTAIGCTPCQILDTLGAATLFITIWRLKIKESSQYP